MISRDDIVQIANQYKITTIKELIEYLDHREFKYLVQEKYKELNNSALKFRYKDKEEVLDNYKRRLYNKMKNEGKLLLKEEDYL